MFRIIIRKFCKNSIFICLDRSRGIKHLSKALFYRSNKNQVPIETGRDSSIISFTTSILNFEFHLEIFKTWIFTLFILQMNTLQFYIIITTYLCIDAPKIPSATPPPPRGGNSHFSFWFSFLTCQHHTSSSLNKSSQSLTKKKLTFPHLPENPSPLRLSPPTTQKHYHLNLSKKTPKESSRNTSNKKFTNRRSYIMFPCMLLLPY